MKRKHKHLNRTHNYKQSIQSLVCKFQLDWSINNRIYNDDFMPLEHFISTSLGKVYKKSRMSCVWFDHLMYLGEFENKKRDGISNKEVLIDR